jgi:hypothetical protein
MKRFFWCHHPMLTNSNLSIHRKRRGTTIFDQEFGYGGYYPPNVRLGYWKFDTTDYTNQAGFGPKTYAALSDTTDWSGKAVDTTSSSAGLYYPLVTNGWTNLNCGNGTIRLWFMPHWSSGSGPSWSWVFGFESSDTNEWALQFDPGGSILSFYSCSNEWDYNGQTAFSVPMNLVANQWYQFALTYSPTNIAFYTNGVLAATAYNFQTDPNGDPIYEIGNGLSFCSPTNVQAGGFSVGGATGVTASTDAEIDELETFNYPLTAQAIAAGYPNFGGNTGNMTDTYYLGVSDLLQQYVYGLTPGSANVVPVRLGYWRFDSPLWYTEEGQVPVSQSGVTQVSSWSGTAANIGSAGGSSLTYPDVGSNGWANINCQTGSLRFWFKPNAGGMTGSGAPFVYLGSPSGYDQWGLWLDSSGSTIQFLTGESGSSTVNLTYGCSLSTTHWTQIVLTYGSTGSALYINGASVKTGTAVSYLPSLANRKLGMVIGNTTGYGDSINGQFDEMETFNYQLSAGEILTNFQTVQAVDTDLDGTPDLLEDIHLGTSTPFLGAPVVITGTIEAEQFDQGGPGVAYSNTMSNPASSYRVTGMCISSCSDTLGLGTNFGYCLDQTRAGEWIKYTLNVLVPGTYTVEARVAGIGTGGVFQFTNTSAGGFGSSSTNMIITTTDWTDVSDVLTLTNGINVMKLAFLTNGTDGQHVGRFNYISIYPYFPTPTVGPSSTVYVNLSPGSNYSTALSNAGLVQSAVNTVLTGGGGLVWITNVGTYYLAQASPNDANNARDNSAVSIRGNNVEIAGAGQANTILVAHNRATTLFSLGWDASGHFLPSTNFTLRDMTIQASPHWAATNDVSISGNFTNIYEDGQLNVTANATGSSCDFEGSFPSTYSDNILVTNCTFLHGYRPINIDEIINCLIANCTFINWDSSDYFLNVTNKSPTNTLNTIAYCGDNVDVLGYGCYNVNIISNYYNGNSTLGPSSPYNLLGGTNSPYNANYANTNLKQFAPDGFVWLQSAGNFFVGRNIISNNQLEAVQFNSGPNAVVGNTFGTLISDLSACAVCAYGANETGITGTSNFWTTFIGNVVYGNRDGERSDSSIASYSFSINVSGNYFNLSPAFDEVGDVPGAAASIGLCQQADVLGNTLVSGGLGVLFDVGCTNALIMDNDFGGVGYRAIGYAIPGSSLPNAQVFQNILGEGVSFHAQINNGESFGWFFNQNTYLNSSSISVPAFLDPASSSAHISY